MDALACSELALEVARRDGMTDLVDMGQFRFPMPGSGVNALTGWVAQNHDAAVRFMKASVERIALLKTDREAAYASLRKWFGITDPGHLAAVYSSAQNLPSKPFSVAGRAGADEADLRPLGIAGGADRDFADASFMTDLDRAGYIDGLYNPK